jgi:hypothetical protein
MRSGAASHLLVPSPDVQLVFGLVLSHNKPDLAFFVALTFLALAANRASLRADMAPF